MMKTMKIENNVTINANNRTIEITKQFEKAASRFGSDEYKALKEAKLDNPTYRVVIKKKASGDRMKGLTMEYIKNYIEKHPVDVVFTYINEYEEEVAEEMTAANALKNMIEDKENFLTIKNWFLGIYPELKTTYSKKAAIASSKRKVVNTAQKKKAA